MIVLIKASTFCPSEDIFAMTRAYRVTRDKGLLLYAPRLPCMEAGSCGDVYALCCHAPPVRRVGQRSAAVPRYPPASPLPDKSNHFTWTKLVLPGEVTLQLPIETPYAWWLCWRLQRANLKTSVRCHCHETPAVVCAFARREQAQ